MSQKLLILHNLQSVSTVHCCYNGETYRVDLHPGNNRLTSEEVAALQNHTSAWEALQSQCRVEEIALPKGCSDFEDLSKFDERTARKLAMNELSYTRLSRWIASESRPAVYSEINKNLKFLESIGCHETQHSRAEISLSWIMSGYKRELHTSNEKTSVSYNW